MKNSKFRITFAGGAPVELSTGSFSSALILAIAQRIQAGLNTFAIKVENLDTKEHILVDKHGAITCNWDSSVIKS